MTMELEGNLSLERSPTRRWVQVVAVIIPVAAIVLLAAWFIRVYVAPATVLIANPPMIVAEPAEPPSSSLRAQTETPQPPTVMAEPANPPGANKPPPRRRCLQRWRLCRRRSAARHRPTPIRYMTAHPNHRSWRPRRNRSNPAGRSTVLFRCPGPSHTAASHCSRGRYPCRGRGQRRSRRRQTSRRSIATRSSDHSIASPVAIRTGAKPSASSTARMSSACATSRVSTVTSTRALRRHVEEQPPVVDLEDVGAESAERRRDLE